MDKLRDMLSRMYIQCFYWHGASKVVIMYAEWQGHMQMNLWAVTGAVVNFTSMSFVGRWMHLRASVRYVFCCTLSQLLSGYSHLVNWYAATHWVQFIFCFVMPSLGTAWRDSFIYCSFVRLTRTRNFRNLLTVKVQVNMYSAFRCDFGATRCALPWSHTWRQNLLYQLLNKREIEEDGRLKWSTAFEQGMSLKLTLSLLRKSCPDKGTIFMLCSTTVERCQEAVLPISAFKVAECMKQNCCLGFVLHRQLRWHFFRKGFNSCHTRLFV